MFRSNKNNYNDQITEQATKIPSDKQWSVKLWIARTNNRSVYNYDWLTNNQSAYNYD